jgi:hypothetical protein
MSQHQSAAAAAAMSLRLLVTSQKVSLCANNIGSISPLEMMAIDYLYNGPCYTYQKRPKYGLYYTRQEIYISRRAFSNTLYVTLRVENTVGWVIIFSLFFLSF